MLLRLIFTLSIFLPTLAIYIHELSHHEHEECEETVVHFHEKNEDCVLDYFISNKVYISSASNLKTLVFLFSTEIFEINVLTLKKLTLISLVEDPPQTNFFPKSFKLYHQ